MGVDRDFVEHVVRQAAWGLVWLMVAGGLFGFVVGLIVSWLILR